VFDPLPGRQGLTNGGKHLDPEKGGKIWFFVEKPRKSKIFVSIPNFQGVSQGIHNREPAV